MREEAFTQARMVIDSYAETIRGQLLVCIMEYEKNNPDYEFERIDVKYDEQLNQYRFQPIFKHRKIIKS